MVNFGLLFNQFENLKNSKILLKNVQNLQIKHVETLNYIINLQRNDVREVNN